MSFNTEDYPGVATQVPQETQGCRFNHTMLREKDPDGDWIEIVQANRMS